MSAYRKTQVRREITVLFRTTYCNICLFLYIWVKLSDIATIHWNVNIIKPEVINWYFKLLISSFNLLQIIVWILIANNVIYCNWRPRLQYFVSILMRPNNTSSWTLNDTCLITVREFEWSDIVTSKGTKLKKEQHPKLLKNWAKVYDAKHQAISCRSAPSRCVFRPSSSISERLNRTNTSLASAFVCKGDSIMALQTTSSNECAEPSLLLRIEFHGHRLIFARRRHRTNDVCAACFMVCVL